MSIKKIAPLMAIALCLSACGGGGSGSGAESQAMPVDDASGEAQAVVDAYVNCVSGEYTNNNKDLDKTLMQNGLIHFDMYAEYLDACCTEIGGEASAGLKAAAAETTGDDMDRFVNEFSPLYTMEMKLSDAIKRVVAEAIDKKYCVV